MKIWGNIPGICHGLRMVLFALSIKELRLVLQETKVGAGKRMVVWKCYFIKTVISTIPTNLFFRIHCFLRHMKNCLGSFICLIIAECSVHIFSLSLGITACCCSWLLPKHLICVVIVHVLVQSYVDVTVLAAIFEFCPNANMSNGAAMGCKYCVYSMDGPGLVQTAVLEVLVFKWLPWGYW